jgi:hypothetical protein
MKEVGAVHRTARAASLWRRAIEVNRPYLISFTIALVIVALNGCASLSRHQFAEPAGGWQTRTGQLLYAAPNNTLIGDVVVRWSNTGDFELSVSKGPGVTLLSLRQDASFAEVSGAFARGGWSGPIDRAPKQLRGWLELRDAIVHAQNRHLIRHVAGSETFLFRF